MVWMFALLIGVPSGADPCAALVLASCESRPKIKDDGGTRSWNDLANKSKQYVERVRSETIAFVERNVTEPKQRQLMVERLRKTKVRADWRTVAGEGLYSADTGVTTLNRGSLKVPSEFALVQVLAHEFAHAIDPCNQLNSFLTPPVVSSVNGESANSYFARAPLASIHNCLRQPESLDTGSDFTKAEEKSAERRRKGVTHQAAKGWEHLVHPVCLGGRRHNEGFCDFIAAEILAHFLATRWKAATSQQVQNGLVNVMHAVCDKNNFSGRLENRHPSFKDRVGRLLLAHPDIRSRMGCTGMSAVKYCGGSGRAVNEMPAPLTVE